VFKKTIRYQNFKGEDVVRDFYFHLSKGELLEMGVADMEERIRTIVEAKDNLAILREFKAIIEMAVGVRSENGELFIKNDEAKRSLTSSPAYDELLMELCTNESAAAEFINNLIPEKMRKEMQKQLGDMKTVALPEDQEDARPAWIKENRPPSEEELRVATKDEMLIAFRMREQRR